MTGYDKGITIRKGASSGAQSGAIAGLLTLVVGAIQQNNPDIVDEQTAVVAVGVGTAIVQGIIRAVANWWKHRKGQE